MPELPHIAHAAHVQEFVRRPIALGGRRHVWGGNKSHGLTFLTHPSKWPHPQEANMQQRPPARRRRQGIQMPTGERRGLGGWQENFGGQFYCF